MDYVGSPTTDFLRKFNSLPSDGIAPPSFTMTRRHSWSTEHGAGPSASLSRMPTDNSPTAYLHPHNTSSSGRKRNTVNEECYPSPPLSPSPSHSPSSYPRNPFLRYDSAPSSRLPPSPHRKDKQQCSFQNENPAHSPYDKSIVTSNLVRLGEVQNEKSLQKVCSSSQAKCEARVTLLLYYEILLLNDWIFGSHF
jgi:autophagy-related protein 13